MHPRRRVIALIFTIAGLLSAARVDAQDGTNVLVVVNSAAPFAERIADRYVNARGVPREQVLRITTETADEISRGRYEADIERPIANWLASHSAHDRILYILLIKGVPLRIQGSNGPNGTVASVDSELTLLYRKLLGTPIVLAGKIPNPYYAGEGPIKSARPFSHRDWDIYLVSRLDGYTVEDVLALIDRAAAPSREGVVVLDQRATLLGVRAGDGWLSEAAQELSVSGFKDRVALEATRQIAAGHKNVLGYYSWGSNDPSIRTRTLDITFSPGALAGMFVSTDGRTFVEPPTSWTIGEWNDQKTYYAGAPQSLAGDLIRQGVTGVAAHVAEPYLEATVRPQILFPAYLRGFNLIESFYLAMPNLSWQSIVVGDPLCAPFRTERLSPGDAAPPLDEQTGLSAFFSSRRVSRISGTGTSNEAATLIAKGDGLLGRGDRAGARSAFEQAIVIDPRLTMVHLGLASLYEQSKEYEKAFERYRAVLAYAPNDAVSLNNLAYGLAVHKHDPAEALPLAERAYQLTSGNPLVADTVGWIHYLLGRHADAERYLTEATKAAPGNATMRLHLAQVYSATGRQEQARAELAKAVELDTKLESGDEVRALREALSMPAGWVPRPK